jgi:hypothetical protein
VAVRAEIAQLHQKKNRALRIRQKQTAAQRRTFATRKSCRSLAPTIGDQISFLNSYRRSPHGKASTGERHQASE